MARNWYYKAYDIKTGEVVDGVTLSDDEPNGQKICLEFIKMGLQIVTMEPAKPAQLEAHLQCKAANERMLRLRRLRYAVETKDEEQIKPKRSYKFEICIGIMAVLLTVVIIMMCLRQAQ